MSRTVVVAGTMFTAHRRRCGSSSGLQFSKRCRFSSEGTAERVRVPSAAVGDAIPEAKLSYFDREGQLKEVTTHELCAGRKVVIFAVPGAFLPTCSMEHLPSYVRKQQDFASKGVDDVICVSVNDAFVMDAWRASLSAEGVLMLADGNAQFAKAMGAALDLSSRNVGVRSRRYSMLVDDGKITMMNMEEGGAYTISGAEDLLKQMDAKK